MFPFSYWTAEFKCTEVYEVQNITEFNTDY